MVMFIASKIASMPRSSKRFEQVITERELPLSKNTQGKALVWRRDLVHLKEGTNEGACSQMHQTLLMNLY
ncbi:hypothetical protein OK016_22320 [Vibrio chagasii]|nr:hypothetical protein [Vibrio chagasii]